MMQTIQKIAKVVNNQVIVDLPPDYANEVIITLKPFIQKDSVVNELEKEIDIGKESPVSHRSHSEIFERLRERYGTG